MRDGADLEVIRRLKAAGIWHKIECLYVLAPFSP